MTWRNEERTKTNPKNKEQVIKQKQGFWQNVTLPNQTPRVAFCQQVCFVFFVFCFICLFVFSYCFFVFCVVSVFFFWLKNSFFSIACFVLLKNNNFQWFLLVLKNNNIFPLFLRKKQSNKNTQCLSNVIIVAIGCVITVMGFAAKKE